MNLLLVKVAIALAAVMVFLVMAYLGVMVVCWRGVKHARNKCQEYTKELEQLEFARGSIEQAISLIEDNIAKSSNKAEASHQKKKLMQMQEALKKNRRKAVETQERLRVWQLEVDANQDGLKWLKTFAWLKGKR